MRRFVRHSIHQRHAPSVSSSVHTQKRQVNTVSSARIWSNYFSPRSSPKLVSKIFGAHKPSTDEIAQKALETEAMRLPLKRQAELEALDRAIRRLAVRQQSGDTVDDEEVATLESRFTELKSQPEPDAVAHIKKVQRFWQQNPDEKTKYVQKIEDRRAYYKKFAVQQGEHQISEMREITQQENSAVEPAPSRLHTVEGVIADPTFDNIGYDFAVRHGLYWDNSRDKEEERFQNMPEPPKDAVRIPVTFVDATYKVYKDVMAYEDETITATAIRNRIPIDASCSDGVDMYPDIRKGFGPGCDGCKCRLDKKTFNIVTPPDKMELSMLFTKPLTTESDWDRIGCMITITRDMAGARIYICPSEGLCRDTVYDADDPDGEAMKASDHANRHLQG